MNIQKLLKEYRINRAKVNVIKLENEGFEELLKRDLQTEKADCNEVIEAMCLDAVALSDIPKSITNKFHSKTEEAALNFRKRVNEQQNVMTKPDIRAEIRKNNSKLTPLEENVKLVETVLLPCLNVKEEFIIRSLYIDEYSWHEITTMYSQKFEAREEQTLKDTRKYAFVKMESIISVSA